MGLDYTQIWFFGKKLIIVLHLTDIKQIFSCTVLYHTHFERDVTSSKYLNSDSHILIKKHNGDNYFRNK